MTKGTGGSGAGGPQAPDPWWAQQGETGAQPYAPPPAPQAIAPDASLGSPHRGPHYVPATPEPEHWAPSLPAAQLSTAKPRGPRRTGAIVGIALVAALIGGGVGGAVGAHLERGSDSSSDPVAGPAPIFSSGTTTPRDTGNGSVASIAAKVLPSVVTIKVTGNSESGTGSGVILSPSGYILTNNHVVEVAVSGGRVQVIFYNSRRAYPATIVGRDPKTDLAVIRVRTGGSLPAATLGRSGSLGGGS